MDFVISDRVELNYRQQKLHINEIRCFAIGVNSGKDSDKTNKINSIC